MHMAIGHLRHHLGTSLTPRNHKSPNGPLWRVNGIIKELTATSLSEFQCRQMVGLVRSDVTIQGWAPARSVFLCELYERARCQMLFPLDHRDTFVASENNCARPTLSVISVGMGV